MAQIGTRTLNPDGSYAWTYPDAPGYTGGRAISNLQVGGGDPAAILAASRRGADAVATATPSVKFGEQLMSMLKEFQNPVSGPGTQRFQDQQFNIQGAQAQSIFNTPENMAGADPALQQGVRNANAGAYDPLMAGSKQSERTFTEQIQGFGNALNQAQSIGEWVQKLETDKSDAAYKRINDAFDQFGGEAFASVSEEEVTALEKAAGMPKGYIARRMKTLKERELEMKKLTTPKATEADLQLAEAKAINTKLASSKGTDGFIDPNKYLEEKRLSRLSPAEFDSRFANMLSPQEQKRLGIKTITESPEMQQAPTTLSEMFDFTRGRKAPNQVETLRPIQKSMAVINQLGGLQQSINKTTTDPIIGTLRQYNPYDFDARAIQAQLQAVVPNLARGVYGEVGVLTDQDIRNYIQTLPNIKGTKAQNDFVMGMTLRTVLRNFESQLETLAAAGYDISGFKMQYEKTLKTVEGLEAGLGVGATTQATGKTKNGVSYTILP